MRYKYLHVFNSQDFKFIPKFVKAVIENDEVFSSGDHYFVTHYDKVYDLIKHYPNVEKTDLKGAGIVNQYGKDANWIFVHSFFSVTDALGINRQLCKKVIWRSWGHDTFRNNESKISVKSIAKSLREKLFEKKVEQFYAVAGSNCIDKYNIRKKCNIEKFYRLPYTYEMGISDHINKLINDEKLKKSNSPFRIMIGHSGDANNHHMDIIHRIKSSLTDNIQVVLVLAYIPGNEDYVQNVRTFAMKEIPNNLVIIDEFVPFKEYLTFLNTIDVAIFDSLNSYALGNISMLIRLGKTVYLNRNGIIHEAVAQIKYPHFCTDELLDIDSARLRRTITYNPEDYKDLCLVDENVYLERWKRILEDLEENKASQ